MTKITLVSKREFSLVAKNGKNAGSTITGYEYIGYLPNSVPIKFTSQASDHEVYRGTIGFDENRAEEIMLDTALFDGKVKYRENLDVDNSKD